MKLYLILIVIFFLTLMLNMGSKSFAGTEKPLSAKEQAKQWVKGQAIQFLENKGQMTDMNHQPVPFVLYKVQAPGMDVYITEKGLTYVFIKAEEEEKERDAAAKKKEYAVNRDEGLKMEWNRIDMVLKGADIKKENIVREGLDNGFSQYFLAHCPGGVKGVHSYQKITIKNIYPNIDWVLYNSTEQGFKYDFIVHAGADYKTIELIYSSLNHLKLDDQGNIEIKTKIGTLTEKAPTSFLNGKEIQSQFIKTNSESNVHSGYDTHIQFSIPDFSLTLSDGSGKQDNLVIDPQLTWATFYGGTDNEGAMSVCADAANNIFVTGYVYSIDFPTADAGSFFQGTNAGSGDAIILKFDNLGNRLWTTYYGGNGWDTGNSITSDASGNILLTGFTMSTDFPVQDAGTFFQGTNAGSSDAFILKFDNSGNRLFATYYGGTDMDDGNSITIDASGNMFVTGSTASNDFPTKDVGTFFQGAQAGNGDVFILKFDNSGNRKWATYYGGADNEVGNSITIDTSGNLFIIGRTSSLDFPTQDAGTFFQGTNAGVGDAFILKFDNLGNRNWATYYGGGSDDMGYSITSDNSNNIFVTGLTTSYNFPTQNTGTFFQGAKGGSEDAFIIKFDNSGNRLWATYYGGMGDESFSSFGNLVADNCGNVYASFETTSHNIHTQASCDEGYYDSIENGGSDVFIIEFSNNGKLLWATYLGGDGGDFRSPLTLDANQALFVSGEWTLPSSDSSYPLIDPADGAYYDGTPNGNDDAFMAKFTKKQHPFRVSYTDASCICSGTATAIPGTGCPNTYLWSDGQTTQTATTLCAGNYTITTIDSFACNIQTATVTINGTPNPIANFTMSPTEIGTISSPISFFDESTGGTITTWDFGDPASGANDSSSLFAPSHIYSKKGIYCVRLVVSNTEGCSDTLFKCIDIRSSTIEFPNVFSPNGDNQNDEFYIKNLQLGIADLKIYNRWGNLIYSSAGYNNDWKGQGATDGVYYYTLNYPIDGNTYTGFIQLIK